MLNEPASFSAGQIVMIPCEIQTSRIGDELLVNIDTGKGIISGFVMEEFVRRSPHDQQHGQIAGVVMAVSDDELTVKVPASFFTTASGLAFLSAHWAMSNIREARAAA